MKLLAFCRAVSCDSKTDRYYSRAQIRCVFQRRRKYEVVGEEVGTSEREVETACGLLTVWFCHQVCQLESQTVCACGVGLQQKLIASETCFWLLLFIKFSLIIRFWPFVSKLPSSVAWLVVLENLISKQFSCDAAHCLYFYRLARLNKLFPFKFTDHTIIFNNAPPNLCCAPTLTLYNNSCFAKKPHK